MDRNEWEWTGIYRNEKLIFELKQLNNKKCTSHLLFAEKLSYLGPTSAENKKNMLITQTNQSTKIRRELSYIRNSGSPKRIYYIRTQKLQNWKQFYVYYCC